jgi:alpha-amylase
VLDRVVLKSEGLDAALVYDRHPRKALVDHFFPLEVSLEDMKLCRDVERGDFATGTYLARVHRSADQVSVVMERPGLADGHPIQMRKVISLEAGSGTLEIRYQLDDLPPDVPLLFAVEINLASMAGHAPDRYYADARGRPLGMLDQTLALLDAEGITLTDEWLDLSVDLHWSHPAGLWCFPIETVSQSEGGFEGVYQSSAILPRWEVRGDANRRWELTLRWALSRFSEPEAQEIRQPDERGLTVEG